ncbi:MAG: phosphomethylpyrimidine synthase, partial [Candidatus Altiarchaeales archaeon]
MISEIAKKEGIKERKLSRLVAEGKVVILKNSRREIEPVAIGKYMSVKINANVGTSPEIASLEKELEKAKIAVKYGSDTIMDLSIGGNLDEIRRTLLKKIDVPLGTVPISQAFIEKKLDMDPDFILKIIEKHCKDGVDFLTLHCGITRDIVERIAT